MLDWLKKLRAPAPDAESDATIALERVSAALMTVAAYQDDNYDTVEHSVIVKMLQRRFGMSEAEAEALATETADSVTGSTDLYAASRTIRDALPPDERVQIIEMLWEVVYADGELDDYEANLLRRVAGLLYVDDRESGEARKRVLERQAAARHDGDSGEVG